MKPYGKPCKVMFDCPCCRGASDLDGKPTPRTDGDKRAIRSEKRRARRLSYDDLLEAAKANTMELIGREVL